ncbi:MFS transporter [Amycolatopsis taiwanensis]|uniref:MFS transporter n=1 Tax=Amycolatopsis taiwanensis TaxID=342230 RepID=A0A9W6R3J1_9PSEU|nr:MFS transporter [Amycolatopsis taiwanensis]GLY68176.1 MFS transporter [Amycolatopsis taiwanensis]
MDEPGTPEALKRQAGELLDLAAPAAGSTSELRPRTPVSAGFQASLFFAFLGTWTALLPATAITLALKVNQIDPAGKATSLSLVLGVGAFIALVAQNIFGALSDRTTSRFGMRKPWILGGMLTGTASLVLLAAAGSIPVLVIAWALTQLTFNILLAGLNPVIPDQVPRRQLGRVSGLIGITQVLSGVGGALLAQLFLPNLTAAILIPGAFLLGFVTIFLFVLRDRRTRREDVPRFNLLLFLKAFWTSPRKAPDFALAWLSRLLVTFGNTTLQNYQLYFLLDRFGFTQANVGSAVLLLTIIGAITTIPTSIILGRVSDRIDRRKLFVLLSACIIAVAHIVAAMAPTFAVFVIAAVVAGLAVGVYLAVDQALIVEVLPSRNDVAKDMGVLHLANVLPQTLVPVTAPLFLAIGGGMRNYAALFIGGAVISIAGAIINQFIKSVR